MSDEIDLDSLDPDDAHYDPEFAQMLERLAQQDAVEEDAGEAVERVAGPRGYTDESEKFWIGREFTLDQFAAWWTAQHLGAKPFMAVGYHHTYQPTPAIWAGLRSLRGIYDHYYNKYGWRPWGIGPHLWVYGGNGPYRQGTPLVYVGVHPRHDGAGIGNKDERGVIHARNRRWLHIEHIHNGDGGPFPDALKKISGQVLAIVCAPHPKARRRIPFQFIKGGVDNPGEPLGIMYHRDVNPTWSSGEWPKSCPGTAVTHANLDADVVGYARQYMDDGDQELTIVWQRGSITASRGAIARGKPSRESSQQRDLVEGKSYETDGYTDEGQHVAGSSRWYHLSEASGHGWVHASGGEYKG